jgi:hypothetical protein
MAVQTMIEMSTICPTCGQEHNAASRATAEYNIPKEGDASFCFGCGAINIFEHDAPGGLRKPTKKEQRELDGDPRMGQLLAAWQRATGRRRMG